MLVLGFYHLQAKYAWLMDQMNQANLPWSVGRSGASTLVGIAHSSLTKSPHASDSPGQTAHYFIALFQGAQVQGIAKCKITGPNLQQSTLQGQEYIQSAKWH